MAGKHRCAWIAAGNDPLMLKYHDEEWGFPVHDDRVLFEFLILEGVQAGLSWQTVLKKRENYRKAFRGFDPEQVARFSAEDIERLLADPGIIRNRLKVTAAVTNAQKFLETRKEFGSFDTYIWQFTGGRPIDHGIRSMAEIPATSPEADAMSRDLKKQGFRFVGPTICYAFMQAIGFWCADASLGMILRRRIHHPLVRHPSSSRFSDVDLVCRRSLCHVQSHVAKPTLEQNADTGVFLPGDFPRDMAYRGKCDLMGDWPSLLSYTLP